MGYMSDIEIAQSVKPKKITEIAKIAGVDEKYLELYGNYKAKVDYQLLRETDRKDGKLILVTAITPRRRAKERPPLPSVWRTDSGRSERTRSSPCASRPSDRCSASRAALPAAAMPR